MGKTYKSHGKLNGVNIQLSNQCNKSVYIGARNFSPASFSIPHTIFLALPGLALQIPSSSLHLAESISCI